jgi:hypothetical protein
MSPARRNTARAREMALRRELKKEMLRFAESLSLKARAGIEELDRLHPPAAGADAGVVLEGRIIGDTIITEAETD